MAQNFAWLSLMIVFFSSACNHQAEDDNNTDPHALHYQIVHKYPHDTAAFTQGLEFYKGSLYEGTGIYGESQLRKLDLATGKVLQKVDLDKKYFGEGITFFGDKIYQLTWESHVVLQYDLDFKLLRQFPLPTQGWGMTHDGQNLIISDGSSRLYFRNPNTMDSVRSINVSDNGSLVNNLNELEYIQGYIYANIWQTDNIVKIDPSNGNVLGTADFTNLLKHQGEVVYDSGAVLNGIAYDSSTNKTYITGKNWPALFEVQFK